MRMCLSHSSQVVPVLQRAPNKNCFKFGSSAPKEHVGVLVTRAAGFRLQVPECSHIESTSNSFVFNESKVCPEASEAG
jgi:hypothetical protein